MFGIAGRRAAKEFTSAEQGRVKFTFSLRKVFWDKVELLSQRGHTCNTAIDAIYNIYDRSTSVTKILKMMRIDNRNGGHPQLK